MAKTITGTLGYRKQYALQCFLKGIDSRARDNCFEMGDGDEVMLYLMKRATEVLPSKPDMPNGWVSSKDPVYKLIRKHEIQEKLLEKLKSTRTFDYWTQMIKDKGLVL